MSLVLCDSFVVIMQGSLNPYEKKSVDISFAPLYEKRETGWNHLCCLPADRNYTVYVQFIPVGQTSHCKILIKQTV